jgi:inositol phosphorylceramide synthase catalytic subunit
MSARTRWIAGLAAVAVFLGAHASLGGLRRDHLGLALAGLAAWIARGRLRPIALFLAPFLIMAAIYDGQRYWAEAVRGPVHVTEPRALELAWFGIATPEGHVTPAAWWQRHTHAWLDLVCGAAYLLFLPAFVAMAAWWRFRERRTEAQEVMWAMLWLNLAAYAIYLIYPAAPPWYVDHYGLGPAVLAAPPESGGAARFDALLGVSWFAQFYGRSANVFGAIPSLHVGQTFLAALYAWRFRSLRIFATSFWAVVAFASVYLNHHYLVDGLAGMALAGAAMAAASAWRNRAVPASRA